MKRILGFILVMCILFPATGCTRIIFYGPAAVPFSFYLEYTGEEQELIPVPEASGVTFRFALSEDEEPSMKIPTGTDAGTYSVFYFIDTAGPYLIDGIEIPKSGQITVIIEKAEQEAPGDCNISFEDNGDGTYTAVIAEVENGLYCFKGQEGYTKENRLTDVKAGETVTGYVKYAGDANYNESPAAEGTVTAPASGNDEFDDDSSSMDYLPGYPLYVSTTLRNEEKENKAYAEGCCSAESANASVKECITIILTTNSSIATINGEEFMLDVPVVKMNDHILLPARFVAEALGAEIEWAKDMRSIVISIEDTVIFLKIDSYIAVVNGEKTEMDAPASIINDCTMLPICFIAGNFGAAVEWDGESETVVIAKKK